MRHDKLYQVTTFCGEPCCTFADALAHIDKRDARIAEQLREITQLRRELGIVQEVANSALKAQQPSAGAADERAAFEDAIGTSILAEQGKFSLSRSYDAGNPYTFLATRWAYEGWQARARLDQPTASAGVVVGALVSALEGIVHDERVPNEVSQDYAALLIEARRLNHCRAQAVPDGIHDQHRKAMKLLREVRNWIIPKGNISMSIIERVGAFLDSAAPSAKKESGDE